MAGASAAALGTRFVATVESNAHPAHKSAVIAARAKDTALTNCFQDGWPAMHRALRNNMFVKWEAAGRPPPGKRPGEGDAIATNSDGCALYAGLSVDVVSDLPTGGELVERLWRECEAAHRSGK